MMEGLEPDAPGLHLTDPLGYLDFLSLIADARGVLTDSGGIQEETTYLGVPCFTLRDNTERPVTVTHGTNEILGLDPAAITEIPKRLERNRRTVVPPLWDGRAGERAAKAIERQLGVAPVWRPARIPATASRRLAVATANQPTL
jgi:UDP-N-acetylglucosamine 2-epimerase (non-hydrolysing)